MRIAVLAALVSFASASTAAAKQYTILVANKNTPAYEHAKKTKDDALVFAERKLHKAFKRAGEILGDPARCANNPQPSPYNKPRERNPIADPCSVTIKVAAGEYVGKGGRGNFAMAPVWAPDATLRILGGYDATFKTRAPFETKTVLPLGGTAIAFAGKRGLPAIGELYISGFTFDGGNGNVYDGGTNSLLKGKSAKLPHITFGYLRTNRLVLADNTFINSSQTAASPKVVADTDAAKVIIRNNLIMNNVMAWKADSASGKTLLSEYVLENNSFIMNWPYNPDPTTSNPAALEIGQRYAAKKVTIRGNIFAHNVGGAIFFTSASESSGPATVEIKKNLFFNNGALFSETEPGASAAVAKFGGFKSRKIPWNTISVEYLEDDYDWDSEENQVFDPQVPITMVKPGFASSYDV
ncbi:MAG: right-handed parallel beta-helix repeat-containing protein, partial [Myxococcota bacterium]